MQKEPLPLPMIILKEKDWHYGPMKQLKVLSPPDRDQLSKLRTGRPVLKFPEGIILK